MTTILSTIFVLGVLIFIHELGHFLVAKWSGIRVDKFSLGFPPSILKRKFGETEYCIGAIPLGGFVKMAGENPDEEATGAPYEFMSKPVSVRAGVVAAGPIMNFLLAWAIIWGVLVFHGKGVVDPDRAIVGAVQTDGPAQQAGIMEGDVVTSINGQPVKSFIEMAVLISREVEQPIFVTWERNGQKMSDTITTIAGVDYNERGEKIPIGIIGVVVKVDYEPVGILPAARASIDHTIRIFKLMGEFVWNLVSLQVSPKMIGGPLFIAQMAGQQAERGFRALLDFMAFLSVNLAILNILPIPVLDGGHLIFLLIEKVKGSPLTINQRLIAQQIGLVFLIIVIVMVTYNDIVRSVGG
jgi:regulator of sigma E protease